MKNFMHLGKKLTKIVSSLNRLVQVSLVCTLICLTGCGAGSSQVDMSQSAPEKPPVYSITLDNGQVVTQDDYLKKRQPVFLFFFTPD